MEEQEKVEAPVEPDTKAEDAPVEEAPAEDMEAKYHVQVINLLQELCDLVKASAKVDEEVAEADADEEDANAFEELLD